MSDWRRYLALARTMAERIPTLAWVVAGVIAVALSVVFSMEANSPSYAALYEGLSPAQGGQVIAALQKLGIPYELQAAGNIISVPTTQLAAARLQLGAEQVPQNDVSSNWNKLEDAPMTTSDMAQSAMADQALESTLEQSIESMSGIRTAQVFLALPHDTPFLEDQPKPTASVVISADQGSAQAQGAAIASLVAGAVPGLAPEQVSVETTSGITVYPVSDQGNAAAQFQIAANVEDAAAEHVAQLLTPLVGVGNFRTNVSANIDFTQEHIHQIAYGPQQIVSHATSSQTDRVGSQAATLGIPGALSNEPPAASSAVTPPVPVANAASGATPAKPAAGASQTADTSEQPHETTKNSDQSYVTNQSDSDINKPGWAVNSIAVSVVLNRAALGSMTIDQIKQAIAGGFAYPNVTVNVLAAPFQNGVVAPPAFGLAQEAGPVSRAALEVIAAAALLFGIALPMGRQISGMSLRSVALPMPVAQAAPSRPAIAPTPRREVTSLRNQAVENPEMVARLLQNWVDQND